MTDKQVWRSLTQRHVLGKSQPLIWCGGEGSGRPIWIWSNPDPPSEKELSLLGAQPEGHVRGALLAPRLLFYGMFFSCKAIVLKKEHGVLGKPVSHSGCRGGGKAPSPWAEKGSHGALPRQVVVGAWMRMFKARKSEGFCNGTTSILTAVPSLTGG